MSVTEIGEKIKAGVVFSRNMADPKWFKWKERKIDVISTNFIWNTVEGSAMLLHFSVSAEGGYYELSFNQKTLEWRLEKTGEKS